tara:strand:+ start:1092 stop:1592 length:501 start_codon:yes stop_codon:yes gene_type:complete
MSKEPIKNNMSQVMDNSSSTLLFSEVLDKVHKAKTKAQKVDILKQHNNASLRMVLKSSFDPKIKWAMPTGDVPFMPNDAPAGTDHTRLATEAKKLYHFIEGADATTPKVKKETMFIQMLEGLHESEARLVIAAKDKKLHQVYKGLSKDVVKEAFNWNDDFVNPQLP